MIEEREAAKISSEIHCGRIYKINKIYLPGKNFLIRLFSLSIHTKTIENE